jgi:sugar/nucleoside kinase (ribokinase family)
MAPFAMPRVHLKAAAGNIRPRVALTGECLIELNGAPFQSVHQTFGGDSLNTALYLARLAHQTVDIQYVTAVGMDELSEGMLQRWATEGIDTALVLRDPARLPGLYWIQVDEWGERSFPVRARPTSSECVRHKLLHLILFEPMMRSGQTWRVTAQTFELKMRRASSKSALVSHSQGKRDSEDFHDAASVLDRFASRVESGTSKCVQEGKASWCHPEFRALG